MFKKRRNIYHNASKRAHSHTIVTALGLVIASLIIGGQMSSYLQGESKAYASTLNCATASNINVPVGECQALLDLYDSTDGNNRTLNTNRDTDTDVCTRFGVYCTEIAGQDHIDQIVLGGRNLNGTLPASLSNITNMNNFQVHSNNISGELPSEWATRTNITSFRINNNNISGELPSEWSTWSNLTDFHAQENSISGTLPSERSTWNNITYFSLGNNNISGTLPSEWSTRTNIADFHMRGNNISGELPSEWSTRTNIIEFNVLDNNITGELPSEWSTRTNIWRFLASSNAIGGELPSQWSTWNANTIRIQNNNITGELPSEWSTRLGIRNFKASNNNLTGFIPDSRATNRFNNTKITYVDLKQNCLETEGYNATTQNWIDTNVDLLPQNDCGSGAVCGNNIIETGEFCDDGNIADNDGCSGICELEERNCERITDVVSTGYAPHEVTINTIDGIYESGFISTIQRGDLSPVGDIFTDNSHIYSGVGQYNISIGVTSLAPNKPKETCNITIEALSPFFCGNEEVENYYAGDTIQSVSVVDIQAVTGYHTIYMGETGYMLTLNANIDGPAIANNFVRNLTGKRTPGYDPIVMPNGQTVDIFLNGAITAVGGDGIIQITMTTDGGDTIETTAYIDIERNKDTYLEMGYIKTQTIQINENDVEYDNYVANMMIFDGANNTVSNTTQNIDNVFMAGTIGIDHNNDGTPDDYSTGDSIIQAYPINTDSFKSNIRARYLYDTQNNRFWRIQQEHLFVNDRNLIEEQCDDGNLEDGDGCTQTCELEPLTCTLSVDNTTGYADRTVFTLDVNTADRATDISFDYGDETIGTENTHIYSATGTYPITAYVTHPYDENEIVTCTDEVIIVEQESAQCQIIIEPGFKIDSYTMGEDSGIIETLTLKSTSIGVNTLSDYQRSITSSAGIAQSQAGGTYIFFEPDISGQGTDTIQIDFSQYPDPDLRPWVWIELTTTDDRGNQATVKSLLHRWHGSDDFPTEQYTVFGDTITDYLIVGSELNIEGAVNASIASNGTITNINSLLIMDNLGFGSASITAIDRENNGIIDQQFTYTEPYTTSYTYNETGGHTLVLQTQMIEPRSDNNNMILGYKDYHIECTECPVGSITSEDLVIDVQKGLQSESSTFPGGVVPYYVNATNQSTQATIQNVTIADIISDNATIISYSFEYNNTLYTVPVNSGAFVIDNSTVQGPIELAPGENIEMVIYAGIEIDGEEATNYIFMAGNWVAPEGVEICELEDSDAQNQCAWTNQQNPIPNDRDNFDLISGLDFDAFQVCADNDQGASTETATCDTQEGGCAIEPDISLTKTLVDNQGNEIDSVIVGEEATFMINITGVNIYRELINRENFSLTDYLSGDVSGIQGLDITNITFDGQNVPYTEANDEYSIDLSNIYEANDYVPVCKTFERDEDNHNGTNWSTFPFLSTSNGGPDTGYQAFLPDEALDSGYDTITRYEIDDEGALLLNSFRYYPGQNDQRLNNTAARKYFNDYPHTVRVCQSAFQGNSINEFSDVTLEVTATITDASYVDENLVCNEVHLEYNTNQTGRNLTDDICFDVQCAEGSTPIDGQCVTTVCTDDTDCEDGEQCIDGTCEPITCEDGYEIYPGDTECTLSCYFAINVNLINGIAPHEVFFSVNTGIATQRYIDYGNGSTGTETEYIYTNPGTYTTNLYLTDPNDDTIQTCRAPQTVNVTCGEGEQECNGTCISDELTCPECENNEQYCPLSNLCIAEGESCGEPICGNGIIEGGEQCDDGDNENSDGCSIWCTLEVCEQNYTQGESTGDITYDQEGELVCEEGNTDGSLRWIVIDRSGSMGGAKIADVKEATAGLLDIMLPPSISQGGQLVTGSMIGISSFNQNASMDISFTDDFNAVENTVEGLTVGGTTNIASGIQLGYQEFMNSTSFAPNADRYMIVLSDGDANVPGANAANLAIAAATGLHEAGVKVFSISVGAPQAANTMLNIASSPADFYELQDSSLLADIFAGIYNQEVCGRTGQTANVFCCPIGQEPYDSTGDGIYNTCIAECGDGQQYCADAEICIDNGDECPGLDCNITVIPQGGTEDTLFTYTMTSSRNNLDNAYIEYGDGTTGGYGITTHSYNEIGYFPVTGYVEKNGESASCELDTNIRVCGEGQQYCSETGLCIPEGEDCGNLNCTLTVIPQGGTGGTLFNYTIESNRVNSIDELDSYYIEYGDGNSGTELTYTYNNTTGDIPATGHVAIAGYEASCELDTNILVCGDDQYYCAETHECLEEGENCGDLSCNITVNPQGGIAGETSFTYDITITGGILTDIDYGDENNGTVLSHIYNSTGSLTITGNIEGENKTYATCTTDVLICEEGEFYCSNINECVSNPQDCCGEGQQYCSGEEICIDDTDTCSDLSCTITVAPQGGTGGTLFNYTIESNRVNLDNAYVEYGDGMTGAGLFTTHSYDNAGYFPVTGHVEKNRITASCELDTNIRVCGEGEQYCSETGLCILEGETCGGNICNVPFTYEFNGGDNQYVGRDIGRQTTINYNQTPILTGEYTITYILYSGNVAINPNQLFIENTASNEVGQYSGYTSVGYAGSTYSGGIQTITGLIYSGNFYSGTVLHGTGYSSGFSYTHTLTGTVSDTGAYYVGVGIRQNSGDEQILCNGTSFEGEFIVAICGNGITEFGEECDGGENCNDQCMIQEVEDETTSGGGGGGSISEDYCPDGDFSGSYYDGTCGEPEHQAPVGKACRYEDEAYIANGPFTDTLYHRGYPYSEIMRISCMHRGRGIGQGLWIYQPDSNILRSEVLKTIVKILGVAFDDFDIETEDKVYTGDTPFADVPADHRFAHYANYALEKGLVSGMAEIREDGKRYLNPSKPANRYEATQVMMIAYDMINNSEAIGISGASVLGDMIDTNNPYYRYVREAEALGFIGGVPQSDGSYLFEGTRSITRGEFAKIMGVPFGEQLFDLDQVVLSSSLYKIIAKAVQDTESDKFVFINHMINQLQEVDKATFIESYKIQKDLFLEKLGELLVAPLIEQQEMMSNN